MKSLKNTLAELSVDNLRKFSQAVEQSDESDERKIIFQRLIRKEISKKEGISNMKHLRRKGLVIKRRAV